MANWYYFDKLMHVRAVCRMIHLLIILDNEVEMKSKLTTEEEIIF
jgi:hypothetical protein